MDPIVFVGLIVLAILLVVVIIRLGVMQGSIDQIVPSDGLAVTAYQALQTPRDSKSDVEAQLCEWIKADPAIANVSREDVRVVMKLIGRYCRDLSSSELVAQAREQQSW